MVLVIALAAERSLAGGTNTLDALNMVKEVPSKRSGNACGIDGLSKPCRSHWL